MGKENVTYLLVDIGNTSFHIYYFDKYGESFKMHSIKDLIPLLQVVIKNTSKVYISYVNSLKLQELIRALEDNNFKDYIIIDTLLLEEKIHHLGFNIDNLKVLGSDLLFDVLGASKLSLVADYGTASKIMYVDNNCNLVGGVIGPGLYILNVSLSLSTEKLDSFKVRTPSKMFSLKTKDAINSNATYGEAFKLLGYYNKLKEENQALKLIICGGDGKIISDVLSKKLNFNDFKLDELITFKGISKVFDLDIDFNLTKKGIN
jgi:pantothenate kinase type III